MARLEENFEPSIKKWYLAERLEADYKTYLFALNSELQKFKEYWCLEKCCVICDIKFLCDPRNKGRNDLCCPYGCCDVRRKLKSNERSKKYYQSKSGKEKKKKLNARAYLLKLKVPKKTKAPPEIQKRFRFRTSFLLYLMQIIYLLDKRIVTLGELDELLSNKFRQQGIALDSREAYLAQTELNILKNGPYNRNPD